MFEQKVLNAYGLNFTKGNQKKLFSVPIVEKYNLYIQTFVNFGKLKQHQFRLKNYYIVYRVGKT